MTGRRRRIAWGSSTPAVDIPVGLALAAAGIGMVATGAVPFRFGGALDGPLAQVIGVMMVALGVVLIRSGAVGLLGDPVPPDRDDHDHPPSNDSTADERR